MKSQLVTSYTLKHDVNRCYKYESIYNVYIFSLYIYTYKFRNKLFIEIRREWIWSSGLGRWT
jgi:hypothetical protein